MKTFELTGRALNWAVILANGQIPCMDHKTFVRRKNNNLVWWLDREYHQRWDHAGPIIEREHISTTQDHSGLWIAYIGWNYSDSKEHMTCDRSKLIAAMRCYVASKLGDEVEVPEELM